MAAAVKTCLTFTLFPARSARSAAAAASRLPWKEAARGLGVPRLRALPSLGVPGRLRSVHLPRAGVVRGSCIVANRAASTYMLLVHRENAMHLHT